MSPIGSVHDLQSPRDRPWFLNNLQRVIPIAESQRLGAVSLTLIALELYEDGFMANFWLVGDAGPGIPKLSIMTHDDFGNQYESWFAGMRGGGKPNNEPARWRLGLNFAPAILPTVRSLSLELAEIQLLMFNGDRSEYEVREQWLGPWVFTVRIPSVEMRSDTN